VDALITLATGTYSNRLAIYSVPILSGLLLPYLLRIRSSVKYLVITVLIVLSFIGLIFSGSTIYWDYSAGNPITYQSYSVIYSFNYHYNLGSIYTTNWLSSYELLEFSHNINAIHAWPYLSSLFDYNKNDLLYLANDVNMKNYISILIKLKQISIIFNDDINIISFNDT